MEDTCVSSLVVAVGLCTDDGDGELLSAAGDVDDEMTASLLLLLSVVVDGAASDAVASLVVGGATLVVSSLSEVDETSVSIGDDEL